MANEIVPILQVIFTQSLSTGNRITFGAVAWNGLRSGFLLVTALCRSGVRVINVGSLDDSQLSRLYNERRRNQPRPEMEHSVPSSSGIVLVNRLPLVARLSSSPPKRVEQGPFLPFAAVKCFLNLQTLILLHVLAENGVSCPLSFFYSFLCTYLICHLQCFSKNIFL